MCWNSLSVYCLLWCLLTHILRAYSYLTSLLWICLISIYELCVKQNLYQLYPIKILPVVNSSNVTVCLYIFNTLLPTDDLCGISLWTYKTTFRVQETKKILIISCNHINPYKELVTCYMWHISFILSKQYGGGPMKNIVTDTVKIYTSLDNRNILTDVYG